MNRMNGDEPNRMDDGAGETPVCPNCLAELQPDAHFCDACGAPISGISVLDPIKQIHATGWMYCKASSGHPRLTVLVGMWLIFGPALLMTLRALSMGALSQHPYSLHEGVGILLVGGMLLLYAAILLKVTLAYARRPRYGPGRCQGCGYDLHGLRDRRCPECGLPFDPETLDETESSGYN